MKGSLKIVLINRKAQDSGCSPFGSLMGFALSESWLADFSGKLPSMEAEIDCKLQFNSS
jgi:hypothetical protein